MTAPTVGAIMGFIIFLLIAGWGVYQLFKYNTNAGAETLRAYIYLEALLRGDGVETAQALASRNMMDLDTEVMQHIANEIRIVHRGRQLPLVAEAYRRGMHSRMPAWYRLSASQCDPTPSVFAVYTVPLSMEQRKPEWVRSFVPYFVLGELKAEPQGTLPGTLLMPEDLIGLMDGKVSQRMQMTLPASLRLYMEFAHPNTEQYRADALPSEIRQYLMQTMRRCVQPAVIRQTMQANALKQSGAPMSNAELDEFMQEVEIRQAQGADVVHLLYGMCMMALTEDEFQTRHGKSYEQFDAEMTAFNNQPDPQKTDSGALIPGRRVATVEQYTVNPKLNGQIATFEEYYRILVSEAKRLAGKQETDIHIIEMMEDAPYKRAFFDGIDPKDLAMQLHLQNGGQRH